MILRLFRRTPRDASIAALYGMIVAQARSPAFYRIYGVPDTVNGRLDMIVLHLVLLLRRLAGRATPLRALGQALFDRFCRDMDDNLREMGVGDLAVPKEMRRIGEAFYGRQAAYGAALDAPDDAAAGRRLAAQCICRRVGTARGRAGLRPICARPPCGSQPRKDFGRGSLAFPDPERGVARAVTDKDRRNDETESACRTSLERAGRGRATCRRPDGISISSPTSATRAAMAKRAGLAALPRLEASFDVTRHGRGGLHVVGRVSATVGQTCVVTLEPIENEIDEADRSRVRAARPAVARRADGDARSRCRSTMRRNRWSVARSISARSRPSS